MEPIAEEESENEATKKPIEIEEEEAASLAENESISKGNYIQMEFLSHILQLQTYGQPDPGSEMVKSIHLLPSKQPP